MIDEGRTADLARLHTLAARVEATEALRAAWKAHLQKVGAAVVTDESKDKEMVEQVLALKAKVCMLGVVMADGVPVHARVVVVRTVCIIIVHVFLLLCVLCASSLCTCCCCCAYCVHHHCARVVGGGNMVWGCIVLSKHLYRQKQQNSGVIK